jgi:hypothetical protein
MRIWKNSGSVCICGNIKPTKIERCGCWFFGGVSESQSKMPFNRSKNSSRSSKKSTSSQKTKTSDMDDDFPSIVKKTILQETVKTPPKVEKSEPVLPPPTAWELLGISKELYEETWKKIQTNFVQYQNQNVMDAYLADWESVSYWEIRREALEKQREIYNKKRAWSAIDAKEVEWIDEQIKECSERLGYLTDEDIEAMWDEYDRREVEWD